MLILRIDRREQIRIGDQIVIQIVDCGSQRARIGIAAPRTIPIRGVPLEPEERWRARRRESLGRSQDACSRGSDTKG